LKDTAPSAQAILPLSDVAEAPNSSKSRDSASPGDVKDLRLKTDLSAPSITLLGIIAELPTRHHPDQLTVPTDPGELVIGYILRIPSQEM